MLFIFDWDGTVLNSIDKIVESMQAAAQSLALPELSREQAKSIIGLGLPEAVKTLYPAADAEVLERLRKAYSEQYILRDQQVCEYYPKAKETLDALKAGGHKVAVATGKSRRGLNRVLANLGLESYFDATRTADETKSKPDPLMLQEILAELNMDVANAVMVGDTDFDLKMAQNIHMRRVGVSYGAHSIERLRACEPDAILDDLSGLLEIAKDL